MGTSEDPLTIEEIFSVVRLALVLEGVLERFEGVAADPLTTEEILALVLEGVLGGLEVTLMLEGVADPLAMEEIFPAGVATVALMLIVGDGELDGAREWPCLSTPKGKEKTTPRHVRRKLSLSKNNWEYSNRWCDKNVQTSFLFRIRARSGV